MPQGVDLVFGEPPPRYLKPNIENMVSKWSRTIREYLAEDSSDILDEPERPPLPQVG